MKNSPKIQESSFDIPASLRPFIFLVLMGLAGCSSGGKDGEISFNGKEIPLCHEMEEYKSPRKAPPLDDNLGYAAKMHCVIDGDTYVVRLIEGDRLMMVRIWGADCPESTKNNKCMSNGEEKCEAEVEEGTKVKEKIQRAFGDGDVVLRPPYKQNKKRKLSYVHVNGVDIGRRLVSSCLCKEGYQHKRKDDYRRAADRCGK